MQSSYQSDAGLMKLVYITILSLFAVLLCVGPALARTNLVMTPCYEKFEAAFTLDRQTGNPFDPADNDVDVIFTTQEKTPVRVPAFWDGDTWRVRFTPTSPGVYTWQVIRNKAVAIPITTAPTSLQCTPSNNGGFVRRDARTVQRFVFDNGRTYYPYGINAAWLVSSKAHGILPNDPALASYTTFFSQMHKAHMNWARIWMTFWADQELDWTNDAGKNPPLGTLSLDAARAWDRIFESASTSGMYIQMTMQFHGQFMIDRDWRKNPYNIANGGVLRSASDFFTDPSAIAITKNRYRYIVARWGYSPNLLAFELFNEVQFTDPAKTNFSEIVAWHKTMAAYIRSIDPYHHLVTTSSVEDPKNAELRSIGLDFDQPHIYCPFPATVLSKLPNDDSRTPLFTGEWGPEPDSSYEIREGLWAGIMSPTAGAAQYWYWDRLSSKGLWPAFQSAGRFIDEGHVADLGEMTRCSADGQSVNPPGDLRFSPPLSWTADASNDVTPLSNGDIMGLSTMSRYLQGINTKRLQDKQYTFHLNSVSLCKLRVKFVQVATTGAHPVLRVENSPIASVEHDYPSTGGDRHAWKDIAETMAIDIPAGSQTVTLSNTGPGWMRISEFQIAHYADPIGVYAKANSHAAVFRAALASEDTSNPILSGHVSIKGLKAGKYKIRLWDIDAAKWLPEQYLSVYRSALDIALPPINEVAGIAIMEQKI